MVDPASRVPQRRMGRPPLGNTKTTVRLSAEILERIEALVGRGGVAAFIREAALKRLEGEQPK